MFLTVFAFMPMTDIGKSYAAGETAKVTASLLNVRSGAGTGYSKIGTLKKGKTVALVGSSGGGKTTICHLLPRFYVCEHGQISIVYLL